MPPVIELTAVEKDYRGLRPLRIRDLAIAEREIVSLAGLDAAAAEVVTNLATGAMLPDAGSVKVFGAETSSIRDADAWLASLDRFAILTDRMALLDTLSVRQNIAIPLTLDLDPLPADVGHTVAAIAAEVGLAAQDLDVAAGAAGGLVRARVRLARAIAPGPHVALVEHPTGSLAREDAPRLASDLRRVLRARGLAALLMSADPAVIGVADRRLVLDPATGAVKRRGGRTWFS